VHTIAYAFPNVKIVTSAVDPEINEKFHVLPGMGNFGDRWDILGTSGEHFGMDVGTLLRQCCGSGSVGSVCFWAIRIRICKYEIRSGSGSFYHQPKIVRKTLNFLLLIFKN
jgi:hypothetical protein